MDGKVTDLRYKEVINVADGARFGYAGDVIADFESGQIRALVVPGRPRLFGILGREEDLYFPWECVRRVGDDIVLVDITRR